MLINLNTNSNFKLIDEGEQILTIKDAKVVPSGAPQQIQIKFVDKNGNSMLKTYKFEHSGAMYYFSTLLVALGIGDGDTFDTNDVSRLINRQVIVDVKHTEYNGKTYADPAGFSSVEDTVETNNEISTNSIIDIDGI